MPAHGCFPLPDSISDEEGALLEPLGVAIHAIDLARIRVGNSVAILGAGPIGLLILCIARLAGASPIFITDKVPWRLKLAEDLGGTPISGVDDDAVKRVSTETDGRGVDVAIEAAWADHSVADAAEMARLGGRLVLVGIPSDDQVALRHSTARRKGLTIRMSRRMKHMYPRAIQLLLQQRVDVERLISHRFPLSETVDAFRLNTAYEDSVVKVMILS